MGTLGVNARNFILDANNLVRLIAHTIRLAVSFVAVCSGELLS